MIDGIMFRARIGTFAGGIHRKMFRPNVIKHRAHKYMSNTYGICNNYYIVLYYVYMLYLLVSSMCITLTTSPLHNIPPNCHTTHILYLTNTQGGLMGWLYNSIIILSTVVIGKACSQPNHSKIEQGSNNAIHYTLKILWYIRYKYCKNSNILYKLFRRYTFWGVSLNMLLILISNMSLLNPGPIPHLSVFYQNVRGFIPFSELANPNPRLDMNKVFELQLHLTTEKPDIVILNETWLKPSIHSNEIIPDSMYKVYRLDRSKTTHPPDPNNPRKYRANGGGVLVAVKQSLEVDSKPIKIPCKAEILAIEIKINSNIKLCFGTCYRVGTLGESNRVEISNFLSNLLRVKKYSKLFMIGDYNLPGVSAENWDDGECGDNIGQQFIDLFSDLNLKQIIRNPTHNKGKILDLLLTNAPQHMRDMKISDENSICKSDHYPIHFKVLEKVKIKKAPKRKLLNFKNAAWAPLNEEIRATDWNNLLRNTDIEAAHRSFETKLNELCNKHIPTVTTKSNYQPPWFDAEVHVKCREKEKWRRKFKISKSDAHYMKYTACRKEVTKLIELKVNENFDDEQHKNAVTKKFWSYVKASTKSSRIPETVYYNNTFRKSPIEQASIFNQFFADQFSAPSNYDICIDYTREYEVHFTPDVISNHLKNLNVNKAPGPDKFHGKLLKGCADSLAIPLGILFHASYVSGSIPVQWKLANVVPVHKKGTKNNVENYRPISLTSIIMKTYEKIIRDELMARCREKISNNQHGFLPGRSCETQLIPFYDDLARTLNSCSKIDVIYFDFTKAFDSVNHDIILDKLKNQYDIDGLLLKFFVAYLKDRVQRVVINGEFSENKPVLSGVPQGSILGPTLFVLFINDIENNLNEGTTIKLYADDTKLYREIKNNEDHIKLQEDINKLNDWAVNNKMKFHPDKCKVLPVTLKRNVPANYVYKLGDASITYVESEKDLGVNFNSCLSWTQHCNFLYSRANSMLGLARRTCHFIYNTRKKRSIYLALVRSQFEHCSTVWWPGNKTSRAKLESIQRKAVRWILNMPIYNNSLSSADYFKLCKQLDLLSLELRAELKDLKMLYDIINNISPIELPSYISWFRGASRTLRSTHMDSYSLVSNIQPRISIRYNGSNADRVTQSSGVDPPDQTASSFGKFSNSYFYRVLQSWNRLPLEIRKAENRNMFLKSLEKHLWAEFYHTHYEEP